ncbi:MAG: hypothetical protein IT209_11890 [Armatimonadetes bacterium]|nr:hypothetical protein [Armatimonadota bacterium]
MAKKDRDAVNRGLEEVLRGADILGNVISRDRERYRTPGTDSETAPEPVTNQEYDNNTSNIVIQSYDTQDIQHTDTQTHTQTDKQAIRQTKTPTARSERKTQTRAKDQPADAALDRRLALASQIAKGPTTTITLRIPAQMNEWLDEYVHKAWPAKVKKQDLVIEALRMLVARRGAAGEDPIPTKLLPEDTSQED